MQDEGLGAAAGGLDPADWTGLRESAHRMLDDILEHLEHRRALPLWQKAPAEARAAFDTELPEGPTPLDVVQEEFRRHILPYGAGNTHPGFMGWVQGGGSAVGMLAEMLAGGFNANCGGRDHIGLEVERQITRWMRRLYGLPETAGGLFLTGASQANFLAVLIARSRALGPEVRRQGLGAAPLTAYASAEVHGCVPRAMEMAGLGSDALRLVATDPLGRIDTAALAHAIAKDRAAGRQPFLLIGSAGTVNMGAIDPLTRLAEIARAEDMHFHVDGALGAFARLAPGLAALFDGIDQADSLAFDFHKWAQVPYDAGFLLTRDERWQYATFAADNAYLTRAETGLAGGDWWPCDTGPDLSRGFRALKTWFTLKTYGLDALGAAIANTCALARRLATRIEAEPRLTLAAPQGLNVVCFRPTEDIDGTKSARITAALQAEGRVAPSLTRLGGIPAIRACIVNHRTTAEDIDALVEGVLRLEAGLG
jgi:glutamate/tyrosine decarboxylase-like PLP-dependent enzyme